MADQYVAGTPGTAGSGTGAKIDTSELTVSAATVERQRMVIGDDAVAAGLAKVQNGTPGVTDYGLTVRPLPPRGTKTTANTAVSVTTTAASVLAANTARKSMILANNGAAAVYVGNSGVTTANGLPIPPGASLTDDSSTDAWFAICAAGTVDLRVVEIS